MKLEDAVRISDCQLARRYGACQRIRTERSVRRIQGQVWLCRPSEGVKFVTTDIKDAQGDPMFRVENLTDEDRNRTDWFPLFA